MNKQNLLKAIELAEDPGQCKYFSEGLPSCVVGQLFVIEGAKEEEFASIEGLNTKSICDLNKAKQFQTVKHYLSQYSRDLLNVLQCCWDRDLEPNESLSDRKNKLVELVINYEG